MRKLFVGILLGLLFVLAACGGSVGEAEKEVKEIVGKPTDVRNDVTEKWKKATTSKNIDIVEFAPKYRDVYMEDGDVHFIIDFHKKNTYHLNYLDGNLYVNIHEYVDKEEHDAKKLPAGMLLGEYIINDDGRVTEVN